MNNAAKINAQTARSRSNPNSAGVEDGYRSGSAFVWGLDARPERASVRVDLSELVARDGDPKRRENQEYRRAFRAGFSEAFATVTATRDREQWR